MTRYMQEFSFRNFIGVQCWFRYSDKAKQIWPIFHFFVHYCVNSVNKKMGQIFVNFTEYLNSIKCSYRKHLPQLYQKRNSRIERYVLSFVRRFFVYFPSNAALLGKFLAIKDVWVKKEGLGTKAFSSFPTKKRGRRAEGRN